jgi:chromosome segregation ATPase
MPLGATQSSAPDADATAEPPRPTKTRQSVRKRVPSQRAIAADIISAETDHTLENSEGEHVEEQDEPDQASANPDPGNTKRVKHGRKTKMAELNEFALLLMDMFKKEIRKEIEPLREQITSQRGEIALQSEKIASQQREIAAQRKEIDELRKELRQLATNYSPATRSYASVAAPGTASRPPSHPSSHLLTVIHIQSEP